MKIIKLKNDSFKFNSFINWVEYNLSLDIRGELILNSLKGAEFWRARYRLETKRFLYER